MPDARIIIALRLNDQFRIKQAFDFHNKVLVRLLRFRAGKIIISVIRFAVKSLNTTVSAEGFLEPITYCPIISVDQLLWMLNSLNNTSIHYPNLLKLYKKSAEIIAEGWPSVQGEEDYEDYYSDMTIDELIEKDSKKPKKNYFDPKIIMGKNSKNLISTPYIGANLYSVCRFS